MQQAFFELVKAAPTIRDDGRSLHAWLFRSVRSTCLDEIRRRQRHPETPTDVLPETSSHSEELPTPGFDHDLEVTLAELTERQRTMLVLRQVSGMSGNEVAAAMKMSHPTAYVALGACRTPVAVAVGGRRT